MTLKTLNKQTDFRHKFTFVLIITIASFSTSCSHLFFEEIQPKGGDLQNEFPSKIQGDYSKWCYTNFEGKDICVDRDEIMTLDTLVLKNLVKQDTNIITALFLKVDNKTINIQSMIPYGINGLHTLNEDIFLSRIDQFYVLNFKVDSKYYDKPSGKALKSELYECLAMELDSTGYVQIYYINGSSELKKRKTLIPVTGPTSYISKKPITTKNIAKIMYAEPLTFFQLDLQKATITGPMQDEDAGVECEPTIREANKFIRKQKRTLKKSN